MAKIVQIIATVALVISVALAQDGFETLPSLNDATALTSTEDEPQPVVRNNCFQVSQIHGRTDRSTDFVTNLAQLKSDYVDGMKFTMMKLCGTQFDLWGIQGFVENDEQTIALNSIGLMLECKDWVVPEGSFIQNILITYNSNGLQYIKVTTQNFEQTERGQASSSDLIYEVDFEEYEPLAGFVGYEESEITAIGFYKFMCATIPDPVENDTSTNTTDPNANTTDTTQNTTDTNQNTTDPSQNTTDPAQNTTDPAQNTTDPAQNTTDPAQNTTDPSQNTTDPVQNTTDPIQNTKDSNQNTTDTNNTTVPNNTTNETNITDPGTNTIDPFQSNTTDPLQNKTDLNNQTGSNNETTTLIDQVNTTDGKNDTALAPGQNRETQSLTITTEEEEDSGNGLLIFLIILISVLIPLIIILCIIIYFFRKNKMNAVANALQRRNSSIRRQQDAIVQQKEDNIFEDNAEFQKGSAGGLLGVPVPEDDSKKMNSQPQPLSFTPEQIKEMLRGKTAAEKQALLKQIEKAKDQKIHMEYLLEQQKLKNDERWAVRNVEERHNILSLYSAVDQSTSQAKLESFRKQRAESQLKESGDVENQIKYENSSDGSVKKSPLDALVAPPAMAPDGMNQEYSEEQDDGEDSERKSMAQKIQVVSMDQWMKESGEDEPQEHNQGRPPLHKQRQPLEQKQQTLLVEEYKSQEVREQVAQHQEEAARNASVKPEVDITEDQNAESEDSAFSF